MSKDTIKDKICFVIAPIGAEGSDVRTRSDQVLKHIITPSVEQCGYKPLRADLISEPGLITSQVIQHVVEDPLVVADLTGWNPNVFYELALRHTLKKPVVQIISSNEKIPFDIAASRTVFFDHRDLDSVARARDEIVRQIHAVEAKPDDVDTPISVAVELQSLRKSDNPLEKSYGEIITMLTEIRAGMTDFRESGRVRGLHPGMMEDLAMGISRLHRASEMLENSKTDPAVTEELRMSIRRLETPLEFLAMESGFPPEMLFRKMRRGMKLEKS